MIYEASCGQSVVVDLNCYVFVLAGLFIKFVMAARRRDCAIISKKASLSRPSLTPATCDLAVTGINAYDNCLY